VDWVPDDCHRLGASRRLKQTGRLKGRDDGRAVGQVCRFSESKLSTRAAAIRAGLRSDAGQRAVAESFNGGVTVVVRRRGKYVTMAGNRGWFGWCARSDYV